MLRDARRRTSKQLLRMSLFARVLYLTAFATAQDYGAQ